MATTVEAVRKCSTNSGATRMLFLLLRTVFVVEILATFSVTAAPTIRSDTQAMIYLSNFGYLSAMSRNPSSGTIISEDTMVKAIVDFQAFAGINQTGLLDNATQEAMSLPRCGVRDKVGFGSSSRSKRYALQGSRWKVKDLTYKISKYPSKLDRSQVDSELDKAFKVWSDYTDLSFTAKRSGQVHIEVRFEKGEHGDGDPFDGPGGTLAHAYFPVYGGDAHFDDAEQWSINSFRGTNLFQVAAHEFGHSLGLSHSDVRAALMAPFYRGYDPSFTLDTDDIQGIQALYGKKSSTAASNPPKTTSKAPSYSPPAPKEDNELCKAATMDTIFTSAQGATYVFKGDKYWKLTDDGVAPGYPRPISKTWIGLPNNLDAAFTYRNGKTYFFKGSQYWRYTDKVMDGDYPKLISDGFTGIPDNVDVALMWSGNGKIYFFKGQKFWRFDPSQKPPVKSTYPKLISNWEGLPNNLEAALQYTDGYTYFFKNGMYYRFNDRTFSVDTADPPFPRGAGYWWFGCPNERSGIVNSGKWGSSYLDGVADAPTGFNHGSERRDEANQGHNSDVDDLIFDGADIIHPSNDVPHSASKSSATSITVHLVSAILMTVAILFA